MNSLKLLRRRVDINMDKIYILRHFKSGSNVVKCFYDVVDRKYVYKAVSKFCIDKVDGLFQPTFNFTIDTIDKVDCRDMKCEICNDTHSKISVKVEHSEDGILSFTMPYVVYKNLSLGKVYNGRLYNGHMEIEFQYEVKGDIYAPI